MSFHPLTPERWDDFAGLFGERGACGGCWCMFWRLPRKQFESQKGEKNRLAMKGIVDSGEIPGILGYDGAKAVGWCSVAPRGSFPALARSRILKPVDDDPCWSVSCLFIDKRYRTKGVSTELLKEACRYAKSRGAKLIEGYPVQPEPDEKIPPAFAWTGISSAYVSAGFEEVARRSPKRPIMRMKLG